MDLLLSLLNQLFYLLMLPIWVLVHRHFIAIADKISAYSFLNISGFANFSRLTIGHEFALMQE